MVKVVAARQVSSACLCTYVCASLSTVCSLYYMHAAVSFMD